MRYVSYLYNAFLWAIGLTAMAMACGLTATVNGALLLAIVLVVGFVVPTCLRLGGLRAIGTAGTTAGLMAAVTAVLGILGPVGTDDSLPAMVSHALGLPPGATVAVAIVLLVIVVLGYVAVVVWDLRQGPRIPKPMDDQERALARTSRIARWVTYGVLCAVVIAVGSISPARAWMGLALAHLSSGDISAVVDLIRSFGPWAAAVSFALMVLQSVAAPIPAFLITFANAAVFGWWQGAILSWSSAMAGAALCFLIARLLGRDAVAHFVTRGALASIDRFFERFGGRAVLVLRLLPFMSFDYVSYAAGLTAMSPWSFLWATGVGQLPATIVYSYVGGMLTGGAQLVMTALLVIFALFFLVMIVRQAFTRRNADLMAEDASVAAEADERLGDLDREEVHHDAE